MTRLRTLVVPGLLIAALALAGCAGNGADEGGGSTAEPAAAQRDGLADAPADENGVDTGSGYDGGRTVASPAKPRTPPETAAVISTGTLTLTSPDVAKARFDLDKVLDTYGGTIADEKTTTDDDGEVRLSRIVVRVPSADFDRAMTEIGKLGDLTESTRKSVDVTTEVIDTEARIRAQEQSLARVEALLARAQNLRDIVAIETQLTRRQAELDSLKSRQAWLRDQTTLSTISVYLEREEPAPKIEKKKEDHNAFVGGLISGWDALSTVGAGLATSFGAVLPFLVVLLLVGLPLWPVVRRFRPRRLPAPEA